MINKSEEVRKFLKQKNNKEALRIAKNFRLNATKNERSNIKRAYECIVHKKFYIALGKNINEEIEKGISSLKKVVYYENK